MSLRNYPNQLNSFPLSFAPNVNPKTTETETINFPSRIDSALTDLNDAANAFEGDKDEKGQSKTAKALVDATLEYNQLLAAANDAKKRMEDLVSKGSALDVYNASVSKAESSIQKIVELLTNKVQTEIITSWFGHPVSIQAISKDRRNDLKLHKRIVDLRKFQVVSLFMVNSTPQEVAQRADVIGSKLVELRDHVAADSKA